MVRFIFLFSLACVAASPAQASVKGIGQWKCKTVPWNAWDPAASWAMGYMSAVAEIVDDVDIKFPDNDAAIKRFAGRFSAIRGTQPVNRLYTNVRNYMAQYCSAHPEYLVKDAVERYMYTDLQGQFYTPPRSSARR